MNMLLVYFFGEIENTGSNQKENIFHVLLRLNFLSSEKCRTRRYFKEKMLPTSGSGLPVTEVW